MLCCLQQIKGKAALAHTNARRQNKTMNIKKVLSGVKVLSQGELEKKLTVKAHKFSKSAQEAIEKAGGTVEVI